MVKDAGVEAAAEAEGAAPAGKRRSQSGGGYRKGEESRLRILEAALQEFGRVGFALATTRAIAKSANVTLPSLQYYFGGKEGLYLACAREVCRRFIARTADASGRAQAALQAGAPAAELRLHLKQTMAAVADGLTATDETTLWSAFVARELLDPGPAFAVMHEQLWAPGIELIAMLIARLQGRSAADEPARIRAMLMIASLSAFQSGRHVALRTFGWDELGTVQLAAIVAALDAEIDAL